jgi:hypothetical protein
MTWQSKIWSFANSGFGIFLFSSIFLGLLSFGYGQWTKNIDSQRAAEQLDLEISLRIKEINSLTKGKNANRYSNLVDINRITQGDTSKFYLRRPLFSDFEKRNLTTLLWQLYLLVPRRDQVTIKVAIKQCTEIDDLLREVRYRAVETLADRPKAKNKDLEEKLAEAEDILPRDFGQQELYRHIAELAQIQRWQLGK